MFYPTRHSFVFIHCIISRIKSITFICYLKHYWWHIRLIFSHFLTIQYSKL